jgi:hypothetical protein
MLTRDSILTADDLKRELVKVPEWGGDIYIRTMTGSERDVHDVLIHKRKAADILTAVRATTIAFTACDEAGNLLFTPEDIPALMAKSGAALDRLWDVARRLNKVTEADIEEMKKN